MRTSSADPVGKTPGGDPGGKPGRDDRRASAWVEISLLLTVIFFGTNFVAVKHVVEAAPPILFAAVRFTLAGLVLWVILRILDPDTRLRREDFLPVLGLGLVGITATQSVFTIGVSLTTAANTAMIYSTAPVWGMLLGFALGLESPRLRGILGVGLALTGVGFVVYDGVDLSAGLVGDLLILAAALFWGSYTVLSLSLLKKYSPLAVATYPMLLGGLAAFPLAALDPVSLDLGALDLSVWSAALYSMFFSSAFGFAAWQRGVSQVGANRVLIYQYLVLLTGVAAGVVLLGEDLGYEKILGALIILAGVYLARRR
jgi:drug/metabolite transporter (DMT)-like permease